MSKMPEDTRWFYATILIKIVVEGDPRNVMHANTVLVEARDAEEAYARALELGEEENRDDVNPLGKRVTFTFVGLSELDEIGPVLDHGTEIFFTEKVGLSDDEIAKRVCSKEELCSFKAKPERVDKPDYASIEIMAEVKKLLRGSGGEEPSN
jgi:hypothetical protein